MSCVGPPALVTKKLRPGAIYTHLYSGLRNEQDTDGHVNPALWEARKRGVRFCPRLDSKFLVMGMPLDDVVARSIWNPAREIHHDELGNQRRINASRDGKPRAATV